MKVKALKSEKRELKGAMTRQMNELAGRVAGVSGGVEPRSFEEIEEIKATLECLENIKEKTFEILEELRTLYQELKNTEMQVLKSGMKRMNSISSSAMVVTDWYERECSACVKSVV